MFTPETTDPPGCLLTAALFILVAAPVYLLMRFFVSLIRQAYGFDAGDAGDPGPPLRICPECHNTVLEDDFAHCPYCGTPLPSAETSSDSAPVGNER